MPDPTTHPRRSTPRQWLAAATEALGADLTADGQSLHEFLDEQEAALSAPLAARASYIAGAALYRRETEERLLRAEERIAELAGRLEKLEAPDHA